MRDELGGRPLEAVSLDVVICTYNRAPALRKVLACLEAQQPSPGLNWSVLVVDNASTDDTRSVVEERQRAGLIDLRYVHEPTLGLTPARLRGAKETSGDWIAYIDDDNLLEPGWMAAIAAAVQHWPKAGGLGGRVLLSWQEPPPQVFREFGYCFAEQDLGDDPCEVKGLVGAGLVLRRAALDASGWARQPIAADRTGKSLVSGGDVEITQRIRCAGYKLRYVPSALLQHEMPPQRSRLGYLVRIAWALAVNEPFMKLLAWPEDLPGWKETVRMERRRRLEGATRALWRSLLGRRGIFQAAMWLVIAFAYGTGVRQVSTMKPERLQELRGAMIPDAEPEPLSHV